MLIMPTLRKGIGRLVFPAQKEAPANPIGKIEIGFVGRGEVIAICKGIVFTPVFRGVDGKLTFQ